MFGIKKLRQKIESLDSQIYGIDGCIEELYQRVDNAERKIQEVQKTRTKTSPDYMAYINNLKERVSKLEGSIETNVTGEDNDITFEVNVTKQELLTCKTDNELADLVKESVMDAIHTYQQDD